MTTFTGVIPAYNAERTLAAAIRSVLAQTRQDFELVIVDDGSTDRTAEIGGSFQDDSRVRLIRQANTGLAGARNTGIESSTGRYVGFLDSDDLWMPRYLEVLGEALEADPGAGFAYTDGWSFDGASRRIRRTTTMARLRPPADPPRAADELLRLLVQRNFIPAEALVRRVALEQVGTFDTSLPAAEDYELWLRLLAHGWRGLRPPGILLVRRDLPDSMSKDHAVMYRSLREVWRIVGDEHPAPPDVKEAARERMRSADARLAALEGRRPLRAALLGARGLAGRARRMLLDRYRWYDRPPDEVAEAFDLEQV